MSEKAMERKENHLEEVREQIRKWLECVKERLSSSETMEEDE